MSVVDDTRVVALQFMLPVCVGLALGALVDKIRQTSDAPPLQHVPYFPKASYLPETDAGSAFILTSRPSCADDADGGCYREADIILASRPRGFLVRCLDFGQLRFVPTIGSSSAFLHCDAQDGGR